MEAIVYNLDQLVTLLRALVIVVTFGFTALVFFIATK